MASNTVIDAINSIATDARVRMAMLMGAKLESNWNPMAVGDGGNSHGIFQINLPFHPSMNKAKAQDPIEASRYMLPRYQDGVNRVSPALWNSDPALAAATAAYHAERPARMYPTDRIRDAWPAVLNALNSTGTIDALTNTGMPNPLDGAVAVLHEIINFVRDIFGEGINRVYFMVVMGAGALLVIAGFIILFKESGKLAANAASAGSALGAPIRAVKKVTQ